MENSGDFLEKMLELGIGMSMIQQVPEMMKGILPSTMPSAQPAQPAPPVPEQGMQVYMVVDQTQAGPFSEKELIKLIQGGLIKPDTLVWKSGLAQWTPACQVPEVNKLFIMSKLADQ